MVILESDPLRIQLRSGEVYELRGFKHGDLDSLSDFTDKEQSDRDFIVRLLHRQLHSQSPSLDDVRGWEDPVLCEIFVRWASNLRTFNLIFDHTAGFATLRHGVETYIKEYQRQLRQLVGAIRSIPSEKLELGKDILDASGYGFTSEKWHLSLFINLADKNPPRTEVHRAFLEHTRGTEFLAELRKLFTNSRSFQRRWSAVEAGYNAHLRRDYLVSIPVLLPQLEGVLNDLLILEGRAVKKGRRLIAKDEKGRLKRTNKGVPLVLSGLDSKVVHSGYQENGRIQEAAKFILHQLVQSRNAILHGSRTRYATAKLSVQILMLLWIFSEAAIQSESKFQSEEDSPRRAGIRRARAQNQQNLET